MKKTCISIALSGVLVLISMATFAQTGGITASDVKITSSGTEVKLDMTLTVAPDAVTKLQGMSVAPTFSDEANHSASFPPVVINGRNRARIYERHTKFRHTEIAQNPPYRVINLDRRYAGETVDYSAQIISEPWMDNASLSVVILLISPAGERQSYTIPVSELPVAATEPIVITDEIAPVERAVDTEPTDAGVFTPPTPQAPPTPAGTTYTLSGTANLDFETSSSALIPTFGRNGQELEAISRTIRQILDTGGSFITTVTITGYSSPEGRYDTNATLAYDRAVSLGRYLQQRFGMPGEILKIRAVGENWSGLRAIVAGEYPPEVLNVIDSADAPDAKESRLRRMEGGRLWQRMEREIFPRLRKVDYSIDYEVVEAGTPAKN